MFAAVGRACVRRALGENVSPPGARRRRRSSAKLEACGTPTATRRSPARCRPGARRRAWRCASTCSRSRSMAAAAGPRCAASRASASGTALTPASPASSSASASAGFSPANAYRAVVRFRWRNPRGKVVRSRQASHRPLRASRPASRPAAAQRGRRARQRRRGLDLPRVVVNTGNAPRGGFEVALVFGKFGVVYRQTIPSLAAGARAPRRDQGAAL